MHRLLLVDGQSWFGMPALAVLATALLWRPVSGAEAREGSVAVDCRFPGGNIVAERVEGDEVYLHQDLRDTNGWWFWWYFRVRGASDRQLTFHFTHRNVFAARGPAISTEGGTSWRWLGPQCVRGDSFSYVFGDREEEVRFAFAFPYVEKDLRRFLAGYRGHPHLSVRPLCRSRGGRRVERIHAGRIDGDPTCRLILTARHHACESMANFVLEGFLQVVLEDSGQGQWFRRHAEVMAIPFMDKDGVEEGDQGKNRRPHDHNRDYAGQSIYPSVGAVRRLVPDWSEGRLQVAIDLHCPWVRGPSNEVIFQVGSSNPVMWQRQASFGRLLERCCRGPLPYQAANDVPFGKSWNTDANRRGGVTFTMWAEQLEGVKLATCIEIPYATVGDTAVDADTARAFGRDLAHAVQKYLAGQSR